MSENWSELIGGEFVSPGAEYRGLPFWSWNGKLEPEKLRRQIRSFHEMGFGGFFMHSRVGLETPYLGKEWFECIRASIDEAEKRNMLACLYDEDRWASGAAGGFVTCDPAFRAKLLYLNRLDDCSTPPHPGRLGLWALRAADEAKGRAEAARRLDPDRPDPGDGETVYEFYVDEEPRSDWFNTYTYPDLLDPAAVDRFLEVTYERYFREVGEKFGNSVPAIFTDEPHYWRFGAPADGIPAAPWTGRLPQLWRERYCEEAADFLPDLFFDIPERPGFRARYRYFRLVSELFTDAFSRRVGAWCERHGIALTGHLLWEDTPYSQTRCCGAAMRHYEHMQIPGIDQLTEYVQLYDACKQLSSAARQCGRRWRISEVYGCTGWDMTFAGYKAMADWQYALGVNVRCLHLSFYTMAGEAKRDYPATFSLHSTFAGTVRYLEDYFARVGAVLSRGSEVRDLLVIDPVESGWGVMNLDFSPGSPARRFDRELAGVRNELLENALDFDYGDEEMLPRLARIESGPEGGRLRVGEAVYRAVLLPGMRTIRRSTLELLAEFRRRGGIVAAAGEAPDRVDGIPDPAAHAFWEKLPRGIGAVDSTVRRVRISTPGGKPARCVLHQLRESERELALFLCNTGFETPVEDEHSVRCEQRTKRFDELVVDCFTDRDGVWLELVPETGETFAAKWERTGSGYRIFTSLDRLQSRIFLLAPPLSPAPAVRPGFTPLRREKVAPEAWRCRLDEPNVLVLDRARWRVGAGDWEPENFLLRVDDAVRSRLGVPARGGRMVQPWARRRAGDSVLSTPLELACEFEIVVLPAAPLALALEEAEAWSIELNGVPLAAKPAGFWVDEAIRKIPVAPDRLRPGRNRLTLRREYRADSSGLEAMYLLGSFGVRSDVLTGPVGTLGFGDWGEQGLPYYAGSVIYESTFRVGEERRIRLRLGEFRAVALRIRVDGLPVGVLGWAPWELELPELAPGEHTLGIELVGSRRNAFGPFFLSNPHPLRFGANEFREYEHPERRDRTVYGLMTPPELLFGV